tara:strand:- start:85 stop:549 length:465 start_codon:yes stop_codon:yes gene_type:complete
MLLIPVFILIRPLYDHQISIWGNLKNYIIKILIVNFDFRGRLGLYESWAYGLSFFLVSYTLLIPLVILNALDLIIINTDNNDELIELIYVLVIGYRFHIVIIKRLRDQDKSGLRLLFLFVPIIGQFMYIYYIITSFFIKGTNGPNKFGPDPREI